MITETIIVALITFTFAGVLVANWSNRKKTDVDKPKETRESKIRLVN